MLLRPLLICSQFFDGRAVVSTITRFIRELQSVSTQIEADYAPTAAYIEDRQEKSDKTVFDHKSGL